MKWGSPRGTPPPAPRRILRVFRATARCKESAKYALQHVLRAFRAAPVARNPRSMRPAVHTSRVSCRIPHTTRNPCNAKHVLRAIRATPARKSRSTCPGEEARYSLETAPGPNDTVGAFLAIKNRPSHVHPRTPPCTESAMKWGSPRGTPPPAPRRILRVFRATARCKESAKYALQHVLRAFRAAPVARNPRSMRPAVHTSRVSCRIPHTTRNPCNAKHVLRAIRATTPARKSRSTCSGEEVRCSLETATSPMSRPTTRYLVCWENHILTEPLGVSAEVWRSVFGNHCAGSEIKGPALIRLLTIVWVARAYNYKRLTFMG